MNAILGGLFTSRINLNLRETHAYTYGAYSAFDWRRRAGPFVVSTAVASEVTAAAVARDPDGDRPDAREPVATSELSLATSYLTGVFPIRFETTAAIAAALAMREVFGLAGRLLRHVPRAHRAVTADDVLRAAQAHLDPEPLQVVAVGDPDAVRADLEALGVGAVREYDATGVAATT